MSYARLVRPLQFPCLGRAERFDTGPASDRYRRDPVTRPSQLELALLPPSGLCRRKMATAQSGGQEPFPMCVAR